jgi:hypothetical protein
VLYFGQGVATLALGSDDPNSTTLVDGDTFQWSITAQNGGYWKVVAGGDFFPLMAFATNPDGERTGNFTLQLFNDSVEVFNLSEIGASNQFVHVGTNTVALSTGLIFDEMRLDYMLTAAVDDSFQPIDSTLYGLLPIFGAPESNQFFPGIEYVVPEPGTVSLTLLSFLRLCACSKRQCWPLAQNS